MSWRKSTRSSEAFYRVVPSAADVADGGDGCDPDRPRDAADHLALHGADSLVDLDRGALPVPVHLDGDARRDDRDPRGYPFRSRRLAGPRAEGDRALAHRLEPLRARLRTGVRLVWN